jgi:hypothetical protein
MVNYEREEAEEEEVNKVLSPLNLDSEGSTYVFGIGTSVFHDEMRQVTTLLDKLLHELGVSCCTIDRVYSTASIVKYSHDP